ncbi:DUF4197 domain-containing protein [Ferruginibacter sp. HRS2-29]|uniref:DUF4197 domain-containing protein n=1 Tax=Ferruginibacter sp. HRS2-29 TaxID=2487334 RepID=UPI0020CECE14|nr:DUF4197 domain-containing protein [Ferruginibacter sp. HRS2-29]MCP9750874.1 DUF4197 domain-containing protein [Ferruginibacter sp. HRS2-29]
MKKFTFLLLVVFAAATTNAQGILGKLKKATSKDTSSASSGSGSSILGSIKGLGSGNGLSNDEIISGLKEALTIGTDSAAKRLSKPDGFFKDAALKILMPEEAKKAEATLRKVGMGALVDKAILSMNRAAEDAAGGVSAIFINAVKGMTVTDGLKILRGGDFAATDYLKASTTSQLTEKMRPVIEASLAKVNATTYWKDVFTAYNKLAFGSKPVNTDLSSYVTERAMTGIFYSIGQEEQKIRKDPAAQVTGLLKKVFGK